MKALPVSTVLVPVVQPPCCRCLQQPSRAGEHNRHVRACCTHGFTQSYWFRTGGCPSEPGAAGEASEAGDVQRRLRAVSRRRRRQGAWKAALVASIANLSTAKAAGFGYSGEAPPE